EIARTAEDSGFSSVSVMDHLHQIPGVGPRTNWMLEGNAVLAALAARTERVNLGLLVGGVMYRNPALLAKTTTTIDVISGGSAERKTLRMVAQYADGSNIFGDVERVKHLLGVLERHCEDVGRDPGEITKTRMATVLIAPTHEEAERRIAELPDAARERLAQT